MPPSWALTYLSRALLAMHASYQLDLAFSLVAIQERLLVEDALHHPWIVSLAQSSQNVPLPVTLMANLKVRPIPIWDLS